MAVAAEAMSKRMLSGNQSLLDLLDVYDRHYQAKVRLVNLHIQEMGSVAQIVRLVQGVPLSAVAAQTGSVPSSTSLATTDSGVSPASARTLLVAPVQISERPLAVNAALIKAVQPSTKEAAVVGAASPGPAPDAGPTADKREN
jgi:adhesin transport system outer membrane protein